MHPRLEKLNKLIAELSNQKAELENPIKWKLIALEGARDKYKGYSDDRLSGALSKLQDLGKDCYKCSSIAWSFCKGCEVHLRFDEDGYHSMCPEHFTECLRINW